VAATKSTPAPPAVIAGRYRIESKLGQGGMGSVWRAEHMTLRSPVAIKLIDPSLAASEDAVARFLREAQAAASLRSPHVVQILDHGVDQGVPYIAMELLEGESLADRLARKGKLSPAEMSRIMTQVARAMSRAHERGIVHRDLKPDNVFLVRNDDEEIAKVLDFGIAKATSNAFDVTTGTRTGAMLGTPYYMSPEQVEGSKSIDHRTDLWALAVIGFECLTGVRPFESETLGALLLQICAKPITVPSQHAEVPAGFDAWFARATQRTPSERFQSAREMVDALRAVLEPAGGAQAAATPRAVAKDGDDNAAHARVPTGSAAFDAAAVSRIQATGKRGRNLAIVFAAAAGLVLLVTIAMLMRGSSHDAAQKEDNTQPHLVRPAQQGAVAVTPPSDTTPKGAAAAPVAATPAAAAAVVQAPAATAAVVPAAAAAAPPPGAPDTAARAPAVAGAPPSQPAPEAAAPASRAHRAMHEHAASSHEREKPRPVAAAAASAPARPAAAAAPAPARPARPAARPADLGF
jgi:serine/threonine-protein kinase